MRQIILGILSEINPEADFENTRDFLEEGLLDSFAVITFIDMAESRFGITIEGGDITAVNFKDLNRMEALLKKYVEIGGMDYE